MSESVPTYHAFLLRQYDSSPFVEDLFLFEDYAHEWLKEDAWGLCGLASPAPLDWLKGYLDVSNITTRTVVLPQLFLVVNKVYLHVDHNNRADISDKLSRYSFFSERTYESFMFNSMAHTHNSPTCDENLVFFALSKLPSIPRSY